MMLQFKKCGVGVLVMSGLLVCSTAYAEAEWDEPAPQKSVNQWNQPIVKKDNQLSIRYSNLTGYGVAYQRNFLKDYYVRGTVWVKYYEYVKGDSNSANPVPILEKKDNDYNLGLDLQRNIISENRYRVYGFMGGGYAVREEVTYENGKLSTYMANEKKELLTGGIGGGVEFFAFKGLSADFGVSYKFNYDVRALDNVTIKETKLGVSTGINLNF